MLNNINCYAIRPKKLEEWCLAEYMAKMDIDYGRSTHARATPFAADDEDMADPEELQVHEEDEDYEETDDFPYMLCSIHLLWLCTKHKIIWFWKYNPVKDPENYFQEWLLLYVPQRHEDKLKGPYKTFEMAFKANEDIIRHNMNICEPFASDIDAAFEEFQHLQENQQVLDPTATDAVTSDDELPSDIHNLPVLTPDENDPHFCIDLGIDLGIRATQNDQDDYTDMPQQMQDDEYFALLSKLNTKQEEFHSHIMQAASLQ